MSNQPTLTNDFVWSGRTDTEDGEKGSRWHQKVTKDSDASGVAGIGLVGFACDLGVIANKGRPGAQAGPDAIRQALANFAWHLHQPVVDAGTIAFNKKAPEENATQSALTLIQNTYTEKLSEQLQQRNFVIGLGGGHEIAWGSYQGLLNSLPDQQKTIGILNFDAHFDLRKPAPQTSSGTPFYQIAQDCEQAGRAFKYACLGVAETANTQALFEVANQYQVRYQKDMEFDLTNSKALLTDFLQEIDELYVTICLDVFPSSQAPGVSAPSALGIPPNEVIQLLHWLAQQQQALNFKWRLADIAEMSPTYDPDGRTAKLAARLVYEMCGAIALQI